jgi:D-arabinose 1-dehydrogenase-like Zn-dependent alcohol dehydrogenase
MCGGAAVWNVLHRYGLTSTSTVGVVGMGGLGHLAIQFASKMGMNVIVISTNSDKKADASKLGASQFVVSNEGEKIDIGESKLDALLITSSVDIKCDSYLPLLNPRATIFPLTVHFGDLKIPQFPLIAAGLRIQGTVIASRSEIKQMLKFAASQNVRPVTVQFPLNKDGIEDSMRTLSEGKMRYRGVLVAQ